MTLRDDKDKDGAYGGYLGVIRHELGHVLGLQHEFQRDDRDDFIELESEYKANKNFCIIPRRRKVGRGKTYFLWFHTGWTNIYKGTGRPIGWEFDYDSCMNYANGYSIKKFPREDINDRMKKTQFKVSAGDRDTINYIYD